MSYYIGECWEIAVLIAKKWPIGDRIWTIPICGVVPATSDKVGRVETLRCNSEGGGVNSKLLPFSSAAILDLEVV